MLKRSWPFLTKSTSLKWTLISCPEICALMLTVEIASTLPMACNCTGMLRDETVATLTGAAGACCGLAAWTKSCREHPGRKARANNIQMEDSFFILLRFSLNGHDDRYDHLTGECLFWRLPAFPPARLRPKSPLLLQARISDTSSHQRVPEPESDRPPYPEIRGPQAVDRCPEIFPLQSAAECRRLELRNRRPRRCERSVLTACDFPAR